MVYFCDTTNQTTEIIVDQIKGINDDNKGFFIICVPRCTKLIERQFIEAGLLGSITFLEFDLSFIPIENDLLSLEYENAFSNYFIVSVFLIFKNFHRP